MNPERFRRIDELFDRALELDSEERGALLDAECQGDPELRREVEALLRCDEAPEPSLAIDGELAAAAVEQASEAGRLRNDEPEPELPERIGRYRPIRILGQGGMGIVYEAEQDQPRRLVALKVLARHAVSHQMLRRFRQESEILGRLKHPGIAQIFDSGMLEKTAGGHAYLAMELIDGRSITQHVTTENLSVPQRLELFAKVCDAVQHAHQKSVIHRDLKPDNILVTSDGTPKVLDFGIARVTGQDLEVTTIHTQVGQLVGTITYMSPEQVSGNLEDLDLRSDIYALGVLLFELLTGKLPHDLVGRSVPDAARVIQEVDPQRLVSIDTMFRGDVDVIVAKAMEKEASRRYASAAEMAADVRRHLADEPIVARVPSSFYHARKFAKRNKAFVGGVLATMLALVAGAIFALNYALESKRSATEARWSAYTRGIGAARSSIATDPYRAARNLAHLPESLRNWEWQHLRAQLDASIAHAAGERTLSSAAFLDDGTPVAALIRDGDLTLVDVGTGDTLKTLGLAPDGLASLDLSADGMWLGGFDGERLEVLIWDVARGRLISRVPVATMLTIANCTFSNNAGQDGASHAIRTDGTLGAEVTDSIVWNDADVLDKPNTDGSLLFGLDRDVIVRRSLIQGTGSDADGLGVLDVRPGFVDALGPDNVVGTPDDDLRLLPDSPARLGDRVLGAEPRGRMVDVLLEQAALDTATVYVDQSASGDGSGESWANAFLDLQTALAASNGPGPVRVLVAKGVYRPSPALAPEDRSFRLDDGMELYGGFPPGGSALADRDPELHKTVLSGDVHGDDSSTGNVEDNSSHVVYCGESTSTVLDGFTITGGSTMRYGLAGCGGGLLMRGVHCRVRNCVFESNSAKGGGAMYVDAGGDCHVTGTTFHNNRATWRGGAIYNVDSAELRLEHCGFFGNVSPDATVQIEGRALISHCLFSGNRAKAVVQCGLGWIDGVRFSATGRSCFTVGKTGSGMIDMQSGRFRWFHDADAACFLPSDHSLVLGWFNGPDPLNMLMLDLKEGSSTRGWLQGAWITCLSPSPDGYVIAAGSKERAIHLVDRQQLSSRTKLSGHVSSVSDVLFLSNDVLASAGRDGAIRIWDVPRQVTTSTLISGDADAAITGVKEPTSSVSLAGSPDRTTILSSRENEVTLLDIESGAYLSLEGHTNYAYYATHSPDGALIASYAHDHKVILWDALTGERLAILPCDEQYQLPNGLGFTDDGERVIAMTPLTYSVWDTATGQRVEHTEPSLAVQGDVEQPVRLNVHDGPLPTLFDEQAGGGARSMTHLYSWAKCISGDGTLLVLADDDRLDVLARQDMRVLTSVTLPRGPISAAAINADNTLIAAATGKSVVIWTRASGREVARFDCQGGRTFCLDFSPDGTRLVSADEDGVVRLWDTGSYKLAAELDAHGSYVHTALFSPDGTQIVSASGDHTVRIWDTVPRGKRLEQARMARSLRQEIMPLVDRLLAEHTEPAAVAEILRTDPSLDDEKRRAALRVLLATTQGGRAGR